LQSEKWLEKVFQGTHMRRLVHLSELADHISHAQKELLQEKESILHLIPPVPLSNREKYAFAYVRAERFGLKAVGQRLEGLSWLPLRVDPSPEMLGKKYAPMNRWIHSYAATEPCAVDFGNDLMHALTRSALRSGWNTPPFLHTASRIARLFHDLACLLNTAYFLRELAESSIERVGLNLSDDVLRTVTDLARVMQSPEVFFVPYATPESSHEPGAASRESRPRPSLRLVWPGKDPDSPPAAPR
jgi:hypothetical protein